MISHYYWVMLTVFFQCNAENRDPCHHFHSNVDVIVLHHHWQSPQTPIVSSMIRTTDVVSSLFTEPASLSTATQVITSMLPPSSSKLAATRSLYQCSCRITSEVNQTFVFHAISLYKGIPRANNYSVVTISLQAAGIYIRVPIAANTIKLRNVSASNFRVRFENKEFVHVVQLLMIEATKENITVSCDGKKSSTTSHLTDHYIKVTESPLQMEKQDGRMENVTDHFAADSKAAMSNSTTTFQLKNFLVTTLCLASIIVIAIAFVQIRQRKSRLQKKRIHQKFRYSIIRGVRTHGNTPADFEMNVFSQSSERATQCPDKTRNTPETLSYKPLRSTDGISSLRCLPSPTTASPPQPSTLPLLVRPQTSHYLAPSNLPLSQTFGSSGVPKSILKPDHVLQNCHENYEAAQAPSYQIQDNSVEMTAYMKPVSDVSEHVYAVPRMSLNQRRNYPPFRKTL